MNVDMNERSAEGQEKRRDEDKGKYKRYAFYHGQAPVELYEVWTSRKDSNNSTIQHIHTFQKTSLDIQNRNHQQNGQL
eukprot:120565-Pelagomonas_calceolata.AAC.1